jgi:Ca2+-binding RTX toxin-like protein
MTGAAGDDVYVVDSASDQVVEAANEGIDTVSASVTFTLGNNLENLTLTGASSLSGSGNALANIISGNSGNNTLNGMDGDDSLYGFTGNDSLNGGIGNDTLDGGDGNDKLSGGADNDVLLGGIGNDTIEGNDGRDIVTGGAGADRFVFRLADLVSGASLDEIVDFSHGETDKIDLSLIDAIAGGVDNAFTFIGNAAFSGAAGQLHYVANPAGGVIVEGSIAGGGTIDFKIQVDGVNALVAGDFVL